MQRLFGYISHGLQQDQGHVVANDRRGLEQALISGWQPIDARRQDRLHGVRHLQAVEGCDEMIGATVTDQHPGLHQGPHTLLEEEGIALRLHDQARLQRLQTGVLPEQGLEQLLGAGDGQRVEPELRVRRVTAPTVLVLGAVVNE
jgi:hypothetical protein